MLYIPKIDENLEILTSKKVKDFVVMNFSEYFKIYYRKKILKKLLNRFILF